MRVFENVTCDFPCMCCSLMCGEDCVGFNVVSFCAFKMIKLECLFKDQPFISDNKLIVCVCVCVIQLYSLVHYVLIFLRLENLL